MEKVIEAFYKIRDSQKLSDKQNIIKENQDNKLFTKCLQFLLSDNIITGISDKKLNKKVEARMIPPCLSPDSSFEEVMVFLKTHNSGKDIDICELQQFLSGHEEHREFYEQMITKKFRLGADAKLVNKVIPGLIPTFNVMLGTSIEKCKIPDGTWIAISQKLNGNRCVYYNGELYTRQGKLYTGLEHIKEVLERILDKDTVVDGELIYTNNEGLTDSEAFQKGTGIANSKDKDKSMLSLVIFDILPRKEFECGQSKLTYKSRLESLHKLSCTLDLFNTTAVSVVPMFYQGTDQSEIWKWLDKAEAMDMEGIMINLDTPYECKRTKNLIKVKRFYEFDLQITGYEEGEGRNKGRLGAFIVEYKGNQVKVGSGFSDDERDEFWKNRDGLIGRVITVKYKEISKDKKTGLESLQFPVFVGLREIGKEVSYE